MDINTEQVFSKIFQQRIWDPVDEQTNKQINIESVSGPGSTLYYTKNLREHLPKLLSDFNITRVLDAPCGDLNWMSTVLAENSSIEYLGGDIVLELVWTLNKRYQDYSNINFIHIDIINDPLPDAELMICRDCLFHFPQNDIKKFLNNFVNSNIAALLTTSHDTIQYDTNSEIEIGNFRTLNLFAPPFNFDRNFIYSIRDDDGTTKYPPRSMYMWSREQIEEIVKKY